MSEVSDIPEADWAVWRSFVKSVVATGAMAAVLLLIRPRLIAVTDPRGGKSPWQVAIFLFAVGVGLYTYLAAAWYLKAQELAELAARFLKRGARTGDPLAGGERGTRDAN